MCKLEKVFVNKEESDGGDVGVVGFVLPNAVLIPDTVHTTGRLSNVMRAGSSNQVRVEEFSPTYGGVESASEKTKKTKKKGAFKKAVKAIKRPFQSLWKTKVENIVLCQELDADPGIPEPKADVDSTRDKPKAKISQDQPKQKGAKFPFFDCLRRGKVEPLPSPQPEAVAARPDEWDDADLGNSQSKTNVGPDKPNAKAKIRQFFNRLRRNDGDLVVPSARHDADTANPVSKDDADLASPSVAIAALQEASVPAYIGLKKTNKQPKLKAVSSPDTKDDADLASTSVADAELQKASVSTYIGLKKTKKQPELKAVSSPDTKDDADLASTSVPDAELQKASVPAYIGLKKTKKQPELKAVSSPDTKDDPDLARTSVADAELQKASVSTYIGLKKTNNQPELKAVSSPDTKDDPDLASTSVADAELQKASVPAYIGLKKTKKQPELKAVSSPDTKDDPDLARTSVADAELQKASVSTYIGLKKTNNQPELKAVSSPDTKDDPDLASTFVADAELQKASVPAYIRLKGCVNHNLDLKNSKQFKLKAASNPDPKVPDNPGQKSSRNPRPKYEENRLQKLFRNPRRKVEENPGQKSGRNPRPKLEDNPGQKSGRNPRPKLEDNPGQKSTRNPRPKVEKTPGQKSTRNPRPKVEENPGQKSTRNPRRKVKENPGQKLARNLRPEVEENPTLKVAKEPEPKVENPTISDFHSKYEANLIDGESGKVFKGIRKADGKEVAIKFVDINIYTKFLSVPGYSKPLPEEVAVMLKLREAPECPYVIQMYDWYEMDNKFILVFEYLRNCDKLRTYIRHRRKLKEDKARYLLLQLLRAVKHCLDNGVLNKNIESYCILVEKSSLHLKLYDFDCGILVGSDGYSKTYHGYKHAASPEDMNVCMLSFLLYEMLNGQEIYSIPLFVQHQKTNLSFIIPLYQGMPLISFIGA
ncbi:uncharacterized protein [Paramisgurnus dabryanus]|uniref:uncharacterized protein n=1 Tax=Paramisgurnus dabryanus TaxID=90735 RepID=UPI0031F39DF5